MTKPDWEAIESAYRAGVLSLREIAIQHGITEGAVRKRAKRDDWSRDLSAKIKSKADDLVRKQEVRSQVRTESALSERVLVSVNAEVVANIKVGQRGDIRKARDIVVALFDELINGAGELELKEKADIYKKLSESLKNVIQLERQAYSINDDVEVQNKAPSGLGHFYADNDTNT